MKAVFLAVCVLAVGGCGSDCASSADIQLALVPGPGLNASQVVTLRLALSINGMSPRSLDVPLKPSLPAHATTVLLRPDPPPAAQYNVSLLVEAMDGSGTLVGVGSASGSVSANGCNRLSAMLTGLPVADLAGADFATPEVDLAGLDFSMAPGTDLACAATPDEDSDGRGDACDPCPADDDTLTSFRDSDGDGLTDACDPDVTTPGNELVYFDPFNVDTGHWTGGWTVTGSELVVATMGLGKLDAGNGIDKLPTGVRAQTWVWLKFFEGTDRTFDSDIGIFVGNEATADQNTNGVLCRIVHSPTNGDSINLEQIQAGAFMTDPSPAPFLVATDTPYRIRLTQRGTNYTCESVTNGIPTATRTANFAAPAAPQYMVLRATNVEAHFQSVVAESTVP